jgi:hypothetical protein
MANTVTFPATPNTEKDYYVTRKELQAILATLVLTIPVTGAIGDLQTSPTNATPVYRRDS